MKSPFRRAFFFVLRAVVAVLVAVSRHESLDVVSSPIHRAPLGTGNEMRINLQRDGRTAMPEHRRSGVGSTPFESIAVAAVCRVSCSVVEMPPGRRAVPRGHEPF